MPSANDRKILSGEEYLTLYMEIYLAALKTQNLKAAIEKRLSVPVDQVEVEYSSDGKSRTSAFVALE